MLLRRVLKLGGFALLEKETILHLKSAKSCDVIRFLHKLRFSSEKSPKPTLGLTLHVSSFATLDRAIPSLTWKCLTRVVM